MQLGSKVSVPNSRVAQLTGAAAKTFEAMIHSPSILIRLRKSMYTAGSPSRPFGVATCILQRIVLADVCSNVHSRQGQELVLVRVEFNVLHCTSNDSLAPCLESCLAQALTGLCRAQMAVQLQGHLRPRLKSLREVGQSACRRAQHP
jgi:hypothetical protein